MIGPSGPALQQALAIVISQMGGKVAPSSPLFPVMLLLRQMVQGVDRYTPDCLSQANAIKRLVRDVAAVMPTGDAARLEHAIAWDPLAPEDFHASRLEQLLSELRMALIEAHAWLETADVPERDALLKRVWSLLADRTAYESRLVMQMW